MSAGPGAQAGVLAGRSQWLQRCCGYSECGLVASHWWEQRVGSSVWAFVSLRKGSCGGSGCGHSPEPQGRVQSPPPGRADTSRSTGLSSCSRPQEPGLASGQVVACGWVLAAEQPGRGTWGLVTWGSPRNPHTFCRGRLRAFPGEGYYFIGSVKLHFPKMIFSFLFRKLSKQQQEEDGGGGQHLPCGARVAQLHAFSGAVSVTQPGAPVRLGTIRTPCQPRQTHPRDTRPRVSHTLRSAWLPDVPISPGTARSVGALPRGTVSLLLVPAARGEARCP